MNKNEIETYLNYCKNQKNLNAKTVRAYGIDLHQFEMYLNDHNLSIDKKGIENYFSYLHANYKQKTVKRKIASLKAFFNYLEFEEKIDINPMHKIRSKFKEETVLPRLISRENIENLLSYLYHLNCQTEFQKKQKLRDIAIIELLFATGIRISELCNIRINDTDLEEGILRIRGKGAKERIIQIGNQDVLTSLKNYYNANYEAIVKEGYFFTNKQGNILSDQAARNMLKKHTKNAGINQNITPHLFRHAFATFLLEEDVDIRYIQKMLGHSSISTTQIYIEVASEKQKQILKTKHPRNKMHPFNKDND